MLTLIQDRVAQNLSNKRFLSYYQCFCGKKRTIETSAFNRGLYKTCGCGQGCNSNRTRKGMSKTKEYKSYISMLYRCTNKRADNYANYGGRGIKVCKRWSGVDGFHKFIEDMGPKPTPKHSIDRINVNGNYTPKNCRWATNKQQLNNTRKTIYLTYENITKTISEWSDLLGIKQVTIRARINRGYNISKTLDKTNFRKLKRKL
jgi:hypothetical protein